MNCKSNNSDYSLLSYQILELLLKSVENIKFSGKNEYRKKLLNLLFNNWNHPIRIINQEIENIFGIFISVKENISINKYINR